MPERRFAPRRVKSALDRINGQIVEIPVDLVDRGNEFLIEADLPGYHTQSIDVTVRPKVVHITATPDQSAPKGGRPPDTRAVRRRMIELPSPVRERTASANYHNGVLRIHVKKVEQSENTTVPIE